MMSRSQLISPAYVGEQKTLHALPQGYGGKGRKWAPTVRYLVEHYRASSVLDYGCGQGSLVAALMNDQGESGLLSSVRFAEYDPAIPGKDQPPTFADLVVCTDVLEHVEPERLDAVLTHLRQLARKAVFLVVALDTANKTLSDGRNAHLIQQPAEWWRAKVEAAGFVVDDILGTLPMPVAYNQPEKREKRWIASVLP